MFLPTPSLLLLSPHAGKQGQSFLQHPLLATM